VWVRMLALGLDNGRVMLVDEATGEEKWAVQAHSQTGEFSLVHVAMSPNGAFVASVGSGDDDCKIWDAASGELHMVVAAPHRDNKAGMPAVAFSPCGKRLATSGFDGAAIMWDARTGEAELRMQGGQGGEAWAIAFTADGARVASGSAIRSTDLFDATNGAWLRTVGVGDIVTSMSFSPTAISILATAGESNEIHLWNMDSGEMVREIEGCSWIAIFSPDGRTIATASAAHDARDVKLMDAESGEMRFRMVGHTGDICTVSWCPYDGSKLVSGGGDGTCKVWDSSTGQLLRSINIGRLVKSVVWGRDWVRDTQGAMAFAMGHHPRLGAGSQVLELEEGVVRMILDRV